MEIVLPSGLLGQFFIRLATMIPIEVVIAVLSTLQLLVFSRQKPFSISFLISPLSPQIVDLTGKGLSESLRDVHL
jgi:hypothetical protein